MKLIKEWREWYKMWSVWLFAIVGVYQWAAANSEALQAVLPQSWQGAFGVVLSALGIVSRLIVQTNLNKA